MLSVSSGIAIVTAPFIVGRMIGATGDSIVAWTVMGSLPVLIGMTAQRMRGRSGAAWWLLSLVLMSTDAVSAVYLLTMGERTLYSGLGGAMLLGALPLLIIVTLFFHGEAFEPMERLDIGIGALGLLGGRRTHWAAAVVA